MKGIPMFDDTDEVRRRVIDITPHKGIVEPEEPDYGDSERTVDEDGYPIKKERTDG